MELECAFDESGTHDGSPIVCVAGYVMEKEQARELDREWSEVLNWSALPRALPYFHMADCAPDPGNGVFAGLDKTLRIQLVARMIGVIKRRTVKGFAVTVNAEEFAAIVKDHPLYRDPYVLAADAAMHGIMRWFKTLDAIERVAYVFETGHPSRTELDALIRLWSVVPKFRDDCHYAGHAFVPKAGNPVVQAADLLAWQWHKDRKNLLEGRPHRKDLLSLFGHPHAASHITSDILTRLAQTRESVFAGLSKIVGAT
jgi:hypothetical protein